MENKMEFENGMKLFVFSHEEFGDMRVLTIEGELDPWIVADDVVDSLDYDSPFQGVDVIVNSFVDSDDRCRVVVESEVENEEGEPISHKFTVVNVSGLYSLILHSVLSERRQIFKRWIADEVLPEARQMTLQEFRSKITPTVFLESIEGRLEELEGIIAGIKDDVTSIRDNFVFKPMKLYK